MQEYFLNDKTEEGYLEGNVRDSIFAERNRREKTEAIR